MKGSISDVYGDVLDRWTLRHIISFNVRRYSIERLLMQTASGPKKNERKRKGKEKQRGHKKNPFLTLSLCFNELIAIVIIKRKGGLSYEVLGKLTAMKPQKKCQKLSRFFGERPHTSTRKTRNKIKIGYANQLWFMKRLKPCHVFLLFGRRDFGAEIHPKREK